MHDGRKLRDIKDTASIILNSEPVLNGALIICHQEATMMNARLSDGVYASLLETEGVKNLFAIGDGAGVTRGLIQASASGVHAARTICARG